MIDRLKLSGGVWWWSVVVELVVECGGVEW